MPARSDFFKAAPLKLNLPQMTSGRGRARPRIDFIYTKNFQGGDATENRDFQREKQRLQGSKFFSDLILSKERIFFLEQGRGLF